MAVYLIHFVEKLSHAGHYIGYADNVAARFEEHLAGRGARILRHLNQIKKNYILVRVWKDGDRKTERKLKRRKDGPRLCPVCNARAMSRGESYVNA